MNELLVDENGYQQYLDEIEKLMPTFDGYDNN